MATSVDICNLALALLGDEAGIVSVNPPDGSDQAGHCSRFYPMALKKLAEEHDWSFAKRRARLSRLSNIDTIIYGFDYAYAMPSNCTKVIKVCQINHDGKSRIEWLPAVSEKEEDYLVEFNPNNDSKMVLTDAENAMMHYTSITDKPSLFPAYFTDALVILLASFLVGPVKRSDSSSTMAQNLLKQYEQALSRAKSLDSQSSGLIRVKRVPSSIKSRVV